MHTYTHGLAWEFKCRANGDATAIQRALFYLPHVIAECVHHLSYTVVWSKLITMAKSGVFQSCLKHVINQLKASENTHNPKLLYTTNSFSSVTLDYTLNFKVAPASLETCRVLPSSSLKVYADRNFRKTERHRIHVYYA